MLTTNVYRPHLPKSLLYLILFSQVLGIFTLMCDRDFNYFFFQIVQVVKWDFPWLREAACILIARSVDMNSAVDVLRCLILKE